MGITMEVDISIAASNELLLIVPISIKFVDQN
jgi:hypothetical protein